MPIDPPSSPLPPLSNAPVANPVSPLPVYVPSVSEPQTSLPTFVPAASAPQTALPVPPALPSNGVPLEDRILALEQALGLGVAVQTVSTTDPRLSDTREWTAETIAQTEAEAGTATTRRAWTAQRVRQAILAWWTSLSVGCRNFVSNPTSDNFALWLTNPIGTGGGFVRAEGATLNAPTVVGPANLTNQDAAAGSRLMSRDMVTAEIAQGLWVPLSWNPPTGTVNTVSTQAGLAFTLRIEPAAAIGNNRLCTVFRNPLHRPGSGANMALSPVNWSMIVGLHINTILGCHLRLLIGVSATATELTGAGVAVVWTGESTVRLQIHNGTTLQESQEYAIGPIINHTFLNRYMVTFNGSTVRLWGQSYNDASPLPRWVMVGELTRAGLPTRASGTSINLASVAVGAVVTPSVVSIDGAFFTPSVVTPI